MKVALVTQHVADKGDYSQLAALTLPNRDEWCQRHGYEHIVQQGFYKNPAVYYAFDRLMLVRDLLDRADAPDIFWVLNVSSLITNISKPLVDVLDDEHDFWIAKDVHGLNAGSFVVRRSDFCRRWLDFLISMEPRYRNDCWFEQRGMMDWWQHENWTWKIHLVPQRAIQSYDYSLYRPWPPETPGNWRRGDLCLGLPGLDLNQRLAIAREWLPSDRIVR